ncbi:MAG: PAS domain-containing protein [Thermodesulfobacteriota bacterium]
MNRGEARDRSGRRLERLERKVAILEEMLEERSRESYFEGERRNALNALLQLSLTGACQATLLQGFFDILLEADFLRIGRFGTIQLIGTDGRLHLAAQRGFSPELEDGCRPAAGACFCARVVAAGTALHADGDEGCPLLPPPARCDHLLYGVPIRTNGKVLGVVSLHPRRGCEWRPEETAFLDAAVDVLAGALQRLAYEEELARYQFGLEEMVEKKIEELRSAEQRFRRMFENALDGIFQISPEGRLLACNPAFAAMLGYPSPRQAVDSLGQVEDALFVRSEDWRAILARTDKGAVKNQEVRLRCRDGGRLLVQLAVRRERDADGGYLEGNILDISRY